MESVPGPIGERMVTGPVDELKKLAEQITMSKLKVARSFSHEVQLTSYGAPFGDHNV